MAEQNKILEKEKKFYFDLNNFDEPYTGEEDIEVPIPTFSEEELEAAKNSAFAQGKREGLQESAASREQYIAQTLNRVAQSFSSLFSAENYRERQYEEEALALIKTVLDQLFPTLNNHLGAGEVRAIIEKTLKSQSGLSEITIHGHPDEIDEIGALLEKAWPEGTPAPKYRVVSDPEFSAGQCKLSWTDGGMMRDPQALAAKMREQLEQLLEKKSGVSETQNNAINKESSTESSRTAPNTDEPEQAGEE